MLQKELDQSDEHRGSERVMKDLGDIPCEEEQVKSSIDMMDDDSLDKVVYIYVVNQADAKKKQNQSSHVSYNIYAKIHLSHTFQLMGCKARDAHEITGLSL